MSPSGAYRPRLAGLANPGVAISLGLVVLVSSLAIGAPATTMTEQGVSVEDFQFAGASENAEAAREDLGESGQRAAWWFLAAEIPFLVSFGLLLSAGCAFASIRLGEAGAGRLARGAGFATAFGLAAGACDLIQNGALAAVLLDKTGQPAPGIAEDFGYLTWLFGVAAGTVFVCGSLIAMGKGRQLSQA